MLICVLIIFKLLTCRRNYFVLITGSDWRSLKNQSDSPSHFLAKTVTQIVLSNSIRPEYKQLAKRKINVSVQNIKLNLSDRKISILLDFLENTPIPINHVSSATLKIHYSDDDEIYALDKVSYGNTF